MARVLRRVRSGSPSLLRRSPLLAAVHRAAHFDREVRLSERHHATPRSRRKRRATALRRLCRVDRGGAHPLSALFVVFEVEGPQARLVAQLPLSVGGAKAWKCTFKSQRTAHSMAATHPVCAE